MADNLYDVVIVGAGVAGSIVAKELVKAGKRVLVLEAGTDTGWTPEGYRSYVNQYYGALGKVPNSPYPTNPNAPSPNVLDIRPIKPPTPDTSGYFVQWGPQPFGSDYIRVLGGTTMHWLGTCPRLLPNDFRMRSRYGKGIDWPLSYEDLIPYYARAEEELGVAADVEDQQYHGIRFPNGYVYPMFKIPESYNDRYLAQWIDGVKIRIGQTEQSLTVVSSPAARNSTPNPAFVNQEGKKGYTPIGAVGDRLQGMRCQGNSSCIPICPVQAKYNAMKTLDSAMILAGERGPRHLDVKHQCVASEIKVGSNGRVTSIIYKHYDEPNSPTHRVLEAKATVYVLAAHAVENAKLLLASKLNDGSGQTGKNLMDHPFMLTWGLASDPVGPFRGPSATSGIETLRDGAFRHDCAAFRLEIGNWGWDFPTGAPYTDVLNLVGDAKDPKLGQGLRKALFDQVQRQIRFGFLFEQLPNSNNYVAIDPVYKDQLGNFRPVIHYEIDDYTLAGMAEAKIASDAIFAKAGVVDRTEYKSDAATYVTYQNKGYVYFGAGHYIGTHRMGDSEKESVVDSHQRHWQHRNLFVVGCGSMPTSGTANPTLTMAALAFRTADAIKRELS
jgi:choline dehydrogenase-like flavoprotein